MAFICNQCHLRDHSVGIDLRHFVFSFGRCESCGETKYCSDCRCGRLEQAVAPAKSKSSISRPVEPDETVLIHFPRSHVLSKDCWCNPEVQQVDPT